jgi:nucleotide-binding universal stress UspA family protein
MHRSKLPPAPCRYASILVPADPTTACEARVRLALELSERFESRLIGCAAQPVVGPLYFEATRTGVETFAEMEERRVAEGLAKAKACFTAAVGTYGRVEWRQDVAYVTEFVVQQARAADLIVASRPAPGERGLADADVDAGDLVMRAGRPVLFVPPGIDHISAKCIVVGWKDTREARRALTDGLPLLTRANEVTVLSIGAGERSTKDVAAFLACHGIAAFAVDRTVAESRAADELVRFARSEAADLIVCGAYGRSRAREWIFGGVTQALLDDAPVCCLMTH